MKIVGMLRSWQIAASLVGAVSWRAAGAQRPDYLRSGFADSSVVWIMSKAKSTVGWVGLEILRQQHKAYPLAKRNELGDSIAGRIIASRESAVGWMLDLSMAGSVDNPAGKPDSRALEHLVDIASKAPNSANRLQALVAIPAQVNPGRAIPLLRELIVQPNGPMALPAIHSLIEIAFSRRTRDSPGGAAARDELRTLVAQGVKSPAQMPLCDIAASQHWPTPSRLCDGRA